MHTLVNLPSSAAPCVLSLHTRIGVGTHLEIAVRASFKRRIRQFKVFAECDGWSSRRLLRTRASLNFFLACSKHADRNQIAQEQDDDVFRMRRPLWGDYGERCLNIANGLFDRSQVTGLSLGGRDED